MNKNQRRLGRMYQKRHEVDKNKNHDNFEEVLPPKGRRSPVRLQQRFTTNKCSYANPSQEDFGQRTETDDIFKQQSSTEKIQPNPKTKKYNSTKSCFVTTRKKDFGQSTDDDEAIDKYQNTLKELYGFNPLDPLKPETFNQLRALKQMLCSSIPKVDNSSQCNTINKLATPVTPPMMDSDQWQNVDGEDDNDNDASQDKIHVSDIPRITIIAKKFSRFKKNNIELRKLEEKVVCVEYDVFVEGSTKPRERMRAFFCIKPTEGDGTDNENAPTTQIPSIIKNSFKIASEDLEVLNEKEIEIIDEKIEENKTYLEDLKRILRRNQAVYARKNNKSLNLMTLYEMAKRGSLFDDGFSGANFLSKPELQEIKDLILRKCSSSVRGISRKTVKRRDSEVRMVGAVSPSIMGELFRDSSFIN